MKLQDLDKTKRYDLRGKSKEQIKLIEEFCCKDNHTPRINDIGDVYDGFYVLAYNNPFDTNRWAITKDYGDELEEPIFIFDEENKQDQFLNELQQLCKKYDTTLDAYGGLGVITKIENEIIESDLNYIDENVIDFNHKAYYQKNCNNS